MFKVNNKDTRATCRFHIGVSIFDFEKVNTGWEIATEDVPCTEEVGFLFKNFDQHYQTYFGMNLQ